MVAARNVLADPKLIDVSLTVPTIALPLLLSSLSLKAITTLLAEVSKDASIKLLVFPL